MARRNPEPAPAPTPASNVTSLNTWKWERSGNYDPARFYTRSRNDVGLSEVRQLRMPPDVFDMAMAFCAEGSPFPYRSLQDLMRDALVHRMNFLSQNHEQLRYAFDNFLVDQNLQQQLAMMEKIRAQLRETCQRVDRIVEDYTERGQPDVALEKLDALRDTIEFFDNEPDPDKDYMARYIDQKKEDVLRVIHGDEIVEQNKAAKKRAGYNI